MKNHVIFLIQTFQIVIAKNLLFFSNPNKIKLQNLLDITFMMLDL